MNGMRSPKSPASNCVGPIASNTAAATSRSCRATSYGPNDNYGLTTSHVLPALIRKFQEAKVEGCGEVVVWGMGTPLREFLHVDDLERRIVFCLDNYDEYEHINCGVGSGISIRGLAEMVAHAMGFDGKLIFDTTKPDGTPRKLMDSRRIRALGWKPEISLENGIASAYRWFLDNKVDVKAHEIASVA